MIIQKRLLRKKLSSLFLFLRALDFSGIAQFYSLKRTKIESYFISEICNIVN